MSKRTKKKIRGLLENPRFRKKFEHGIKKWQKKYQPLIDAAKASERITEKDLNIVINAR